MLSDGARRQLVDVAWRSVIARVNGSRTLPPAAPLEWPPASGVFVTLKIDGRLRGCLGTLESLGDLASDVVACAADAASRDPRFPAVGPHELDGLALEISVLGPFERIDPCRGDAVSIGVHGLLVERGRRRGLLLPQVATEWQWNVEQFLCQTCVKAGLEAEAWERDAIVYRFTADVFGT
jgi:AmmeMemoRadiSam system protein A